MTARDFHWPAGTVTAALASAAVTPATARALRERLTPPPFEAVLDDGTLALLAAVCDRLVPQPDRAVPIDVADGVHRRLAGPGDGWRYAALPDDRTATVQGLAAIDASAVAMFGAGFATLPTMQRDAVLTAVQAGAVTGWNGPDPQRFFAELLATAAEAYWSHPLAQEEIGYLGMADVPGWTAIGLDERQPPEPVAL